MRVLPIKRREPPLFAHRRRMDELKRQQRRARELQDYQDWLQLQVERQPSLDLRVGTVHHLARPLAHAA